MEEDGMARGMAQGDRLAKFRRVTDLFEEGRIVVLDPDPEDPTVLWVNKLNPFEMDECRRDGTVGRSRALLALDDADTTEHQVYAQALSERTPDDMKKALLYAKQNEHYVRALDDIRADKEWAPKVLLLERGDAQLDDAGADMDDDERSRLATLNQEYLAQVTKLLDQHQQEYRAELDAMGEDEVRRLYVEQYRDAAGGSSYLNEYRQSEMFFAMRVCDALPMKGEGTGWDHSNCDHRERLCQYRSDIRTLPEGLINAVRDAMLALNMSPRDAGNSDAPASSSASSEQHDVAAESTPSTPAVK